MRTGVQAPDTLADVKVSRRAATVCAVAAASILLVALFITALRVRELSWLERLALISTALSPLLIVASVYLVLRQVEEASSTVKAQLFDATAGRMLELSRVFVEHPELRPYFYDGRDLDAATEPTRCRALAVAEMHLDYFDTELLRSRSFERTIRGSLPPFDPWVRGLFRTSPVMCRRMADDAALGHERWYDAVHALYRHVVATGEAAWTPPAPSDP